MLHPLVTILGKSVRQVARLRGGGSALPGLFVESIDKGFVKRSLDQLPRGVVIISGTNGKTTTTKMVVELLESQGLKVLTNRTGSNFVRGVIAALLEAMNTRGKLDHDIAVLELDEAHAVHFVRTVQPRYSLLLNVMRDQLDRFGEIDTTARMLDTIARATTKHVVLNREDPRISAIARSIDIQHSFFGLSPTLREMFPHDDAMRSGDSSDSGDTSEIDNAQPARVLLGSLTPTGAVFEFGGKSYETSLALKGVYNIYNAAAALTLAMTVLGDDASFDALITSLATVEPAFGRGETLMIGGQPLELVLVKNPSGFRLSLASFSPEHTATMVAINDNYADGRDMSWLWDVEFDSLRASGVDMVSGIRGYDMALRLDYDDIAVRAVDTDLATALDAFIAGNSPSAKRIYCTYTCMLELRQLLQKYTDVERIL